MAESKSWSAEVDQMSSSEEDGQSMSDLTKYQVEETAEGVLVTVTAGKQDASEEVATVEQLATVVGEVRE